MADTANGTLIPRIFQKIILRDKINNNNKGSECSIVSEREKQPSNATYHLRDLGAF